MDEELGRLTKVSLRKFWEREDKDFTPWLADEENVSLLGKTIGIELEVEAQEKEVGAFRADILCKDTVTDNWVVIENQLEPTDHTHLGQLLTYAAGLEAVTVVWIAEYFTDEHRAALDWLNEITDEKFSFFGLEIELWRIGESPMAPKFNVVSHPNDWTRTISRISRAELTPSQQLYIEYWTGLRYLLKQHESVITPGLPSRNFWLYCGIDSSNLWLSASASMKGKWIRVSLALRGKDGTDRFRRLKMDKTDIEDEVGAKLEWGGKYKQKRRYISLYLDEADPEDREDWNRQHQWLCKTLEAFHDAFSTRVKALD